VHEVFRVLATRARAGRQAGARQDGFRVALAGSVIEVMEPTSLDTLTMRAAGARRSSGSIALVTMITPNTLVS
jgi:hypothetical protein